MGLVLADFAVKAPCSRNLHGPPPRDQLLEALPSLGQELEATCSA